MFRWQVPIWIRSEIASECSFLALSADAYTCSMDAHERQYSGSLVHICSLLTRSLVKRVKVTSSRHTTGLTEELDCAWCAPGKYQTGAGLIAEANCTWCTEGKYQSGSGLVAEVNCTWCTAGKYQTGSGLVSCCLFGAICLVSRKHLRAQCYGVTLRQQCGF